MANPWEIYLRESIASDIAITPWQGDASLPLSLEDQYRFYQVVLLGEACLLVEPVGEAPGLEALKKHLQTIARQSKLNVVVLFKNISTFRRKSLLENRIPFLVENGQMYLPFLGLDLKRTTKEQLALAESFTPLAQLMFLAFLYQSDLHISATELAKMLDVTSMSASRVLNELYGKGLLHYQKGGYKGRSKKYQRIADPEYYQLGRGFLKNPVRQVLYLDEALAEYPVAGLDALARVSMLNPPSCPVHAVGPKQAGQYKARTVRNRDLIADNDYAELQVWDYAPNLLAGSGVVDIVSLALSLQDEADVRVKQAIEERMRGESWYTA